MSCALLRSGSADEPGSRGEAWLPLFAMPGRPHVGPLPELTDAERTLATALETDVTALAIEIGERHAGRFHYDNLRKAEALLAERLTAAGYEVERESFEARGRTVANLVVERRGTTSSGSRTVIAVPLPGALSTRIRPRWASTISRHAVSPRPLPPLPVSSGPALVEKWGSKMRRSTSAFGSSLVKYYGLAFASETSTLVLCGGNRVTFFSVKVTNRPTLVTFGVSIIFIHDKNISKLTTDIQMKKRKKERFTIMEWEEKANRLARSKSGISYLWCISNRRRSPHHR